CAVWHSSAYIF
nr:immunoglobulin light chain junction region [Macaca mulatta]